ncbi:MAG: DNA polymerase III subunit delta [Bacteroidota bacterium]|nr:DNA polymerase III subunit delta [Bacteroidota bacterium]
MDYKDIINLLLKQGPKPIFFLGGDEAFFIDQIMNFAEENIIPSEESDFNCQVLYGKETSMKQLVDICRENPFMGTRKLVLLKEAQEIKDKEWELCIPYLKNPVQTTLLVIAFKNKRPDGRLLWVKAVKENTIYFESNELKDYQLPAFITSQLKLAGFKIDEEASLLMAEFIGNNLSQIFNEIQKLKLNIEKGSNISKDMIAEQIGFSKECNVFELQKAFNTRDVKKIYFISANLAANIKNNPLVMIIGALFNYFTKIWLTKQYLSKNDKDLMSILKLSYASYLNDYRMAASKYTLASLENAIQLLSNYDLKSKGVNVHTVKDNDLLLELILRLNRI